MRGSASTTGTRSGPRNWPSSIPITWASSAWRRISLAVRTARDGILSSEWDTMWSRPKRSSMIGLKISTRWRAIWARRSRRISSSVLPLYMLPTMTSIQP